MAANPYRKVNAGEQLPGIPAQLFNTLIDVANLQRSGQLEARSNAPVLGSLPERGIVVPVRNDSGENRARGHILRITDFLIDPDDNSNHFKNRPCLVGDEPNDLLSQKFVILQEPVADGKIGRGMICGLTAVTIDVIDADDGFADVIDEDCTKLRSFPWGCCPILAKESGTGSVLAYVAIGDFKRQPAIGKADGAISQGNTGTISVWSDATTTLADTGQNVTAYSRFGDIESGAWVALLPHQWGWEAVQTPCPA